jgi:proteasome activator subunit 4
MEGDIQPHQQRLVPATSTIRNWVRRAGLVTSYMPTKLSRQIPSYMGLIAETCRRFFHPACTEDVLETLLPTLIGTSLDSVLANQYYLLTFLPQSHPQIYLSTLFRLWEGVNSYIYDDRMLGFLAQLAELHVNPMVSDPSRISSIPDDAVGPGEERHKWDYSDLKQQGSWSGMGKDVGIFTRDEWNRIMCKMLSTMGKSLHNNHMSGTLTLEF